MFLVFKEISPVLWDQLFNLYFMGTNIPDLVIKAHLTEILF